MPKDDPVSKSPANPHSIDDNSRIVMLYAQVNSAGEWETDCQGQILPTDDSADNPDDIEMAGKKNVYLVLPNPPGFTLQVTSSDFYSSPDPQDPNTTPQEPTAPPPTSEDNTWTSGTLVDGSKSKQSKPISIGYSFLKMSNQSGWAGKTKERDVKICFTATDAAGNTTTADPVFKIKVQRPA